MIKQSLCQERRDFEMFRLFFSDITQIVRIVYTFFSIFYHLFSFYHGFCAGSMNFSQLYVVFLSIFFHVQILFNFMMMPGSKGQKAVHACMIRLLNLGPAKHEKVAIYVVNQQISNVCRIAGAASPRSNS